MVCASRRQIENVGDRILRPYMPLGTKKKSEVNLIQKKIVRIMFISKYKAKFRPIFMSRK